MYDSKDISDILKEIERKRQESGSDGSVPENEEVAETAVEEAPAAAPEPEPVQETQSFAQAPSPAPEPAHLQQMPQDHGYAYNGYPQGMPPGARPVRPNAARKKKKKRKKGNANRISGVLFLIALIFGSSVILSMVIIAYGKDMLGIGKSDSTQVVFIDEGSSVEQISIMLKDEGIIRSPKAFQLFAKLRRSDKGYLPGEHFLRPDMAYETIINELTQAKAAQRGESIEVVFPEGINLLQAAQILEDKGICNAGDFVFYFNAGQYGLNFEKLLPTDTSLKFNKMEGYLFPDTYFFYQDSELDEVCQKIYYNFETKMTEERLNKMKELNLTLDQLVTFASIVQLEAGKTEDMAEIAAVFWNRMEHPDFQGTGGRLESSPTQNYSKLVRQNMEYFDKTIVESYDTFKSVGLPPGAICNPGIEAIDAVLEHKSSSNYFFYANIYTKETMFAETYDQHKENEQEIKRQMAEYEAEMATAENNEE